MCFILTSKTYSLEMQTNSSTRFRERLFNIKSPLFNVVYDEIDMAEYSKYRYVQLSWQILESTKIVGQWKGSPCARLCVAIYCQRKTTSWTEGAEVDLSHYLLRNLSFSCLQISCLCIWAMWMVAAHPRACVLQLCDFHRGTLNSKSVMCFVKLTTAPETLPSPRAIIWSSRDCTSTCTHQTNHYWFQASNCTEYFMNKFVPMTDYVPVAEDFSDLQDKVSSPVHHTEHAE